MELIISVAVGCFFFLLLTGSFSRKKKWDHRAQRNWWDERNKWK